MNYFGEKNDEREAMPMKSGCLKVKLWRLSGNYDDSRGDPQIIADDVSIDFQHLLGSGWMDDLNLMIVFLCGHMTEDPILDSAPPPEFDEETGEVPDERHRKMMRLTTGVLASPEVTQLLRLPMVILTAQMDIMVQTVTV